MHDPFGLVGQTLQRQFRIDAVAGEGGFGIVYRGFHLSFEHPVAIKCLKIPSHFTTDARELFVERFRDEGKLLSMLSQHPSIVRVFDFGVTTAAGSAVPFLVLEWLQGRDLSALLAERVRSVGAPFTEREAIELLRPAIDAIAAAHRLGVAHRDIKPANLFACETSLGPTVKVLDFGIAKAMQEGETATQAVTHSQSLFRAFSPTYGAPEQFYAKRFGATGPWTDVHALGLILTELVSGRPAFDGDELAEWLQAALSEHRPTPRARGASVSDAFEALCAKAVALQPSQRFANAGELLDALMAGTRAPAPARSAPLHATVPLDTPARAPAPARSAPLHATVPLDAAALVEATAASWPGAASAPASAVSAPSSPGSAPEQRRSGPALAIAAAAALALVASIVFALVVFVLPLWEERSDVHAVARGDSDAAIGTRANAGAEEQRALVPSSFSDDFERVQLGERWIATGGPWRIEGGELAVERAHNHPLWLARPIPRDVRIDFDVRSASPDGDIKVELFGDGASSAQPGRSYESSGYVVIFGGWSNTVSLLARLNEHGDDRVFGTRRRAIPGRTHHIRIERGGPALVVWVDGEELVRMVDAQPLEGPGHDRFGFNDWESSLRFDNLRIEPLDPGRARALARLPSALREQALAEQFEPYALGATVDETWRAMAALRRGRPRHLPRWDRLPHAGEYTSTEVRYFWENFADLEALPFGRSLSPCRSAAASYVCWLFENDRLFRVSVRLQGCPEGWGIAQQLARELGLTTLEAGGRVPAQELGQRSRSHISRAENVVMIELETPDAPWPGGG